MDLQLRLCSKHLPPTPPVQGSSSLQAQVQFQCNKCMIYVWLAIPICIPGAGANGMHTWNQPNLVIAYQPAVVPTLAFFLVQCAGTRQLQLECLFY